MSAVHEQTQSHHFTRKRFALPNEFAKIPEKASEHSPEGNKPPVKCPKCGFVSYPGLPRCKKCGHEFLPAPRKETSASTPDTLISLFPGSAVPSPAPSDPSLPAPPPATTENSPSLAPLPIEVDERSPLEADSEMTSSPAEASPAEDEQLASASADLELPPVAEIVPAADLVRPWREELAQRVKNFRRRRARLRQGLDPNLSLDFDSQTPGSEPTKTAVEPQAIEPPESEPELDVTLESPAGAEIESSTLDALPLEIAEADSESSSSPAVEASDLPLEQDTPDLEPAPVEIVLESSPSPSSAAASPAASLLMTQAPLGRRFVAGLADMLILLAAAGLFGIVFWRAGGHISPQPLNLLILGFIAAFFILVYFGLFTALTSSTPGLLWMGLEVRNLEGDHPTSRESSWRAFGYLASVAGLMLGFIWALVDSEGLTWHDRISGTFLTVIEREPQ